MLQSPPHPFSSLSRHAHSHSRGFAPALPCAWNDLDVYLLTCIGVENIILTLKIQIEEIERLQLEKREELDQLDETIKYILEEISQMEAMKIKLLKEIAGI